MGKAAKVSTCQLFDRVAAHALCWLIEQQHDTVLSAAPFAHLHDCHQQTVSAVPTESLQSAANNDYAAVSAAAVTRVVSSGHINVQVNILTKVSIA
jgi:hypothetical protein